MRQLYPPAAALATYRIDVGDGHRVHVEECGNPVGRPVLFLHGGPGSGFNALHCRYFDPAHYRIVLVDQRGCGRSTPLGETRANSTDNLVRDLEAVRQTLRIRRWILFGGSWGATLALCYAQAFPDAVSAMVLRGSFLARGKDLAWFFAKAGAARIFPDAYDEFLRPVPGAERQDLVGAYCRRVQAPDRDVALAWARAWGAWGDRVVTWNLPPSERKDEIDPERLLAKVRIETHYAFNRYFLADRPLLDGASRLPDVSIAIVHGRRDLICPFEAAWAMHRAIPGSRLVPVPEAGHLAVEPKMIDALVGEMDRLRR